MSLDSDSYHIDDFDVQFDIDDNTIATTSVNSIDSTSSLNHIPYLAFLVLSLSAIIYPPSFIYSLVVYLSQICFSNTLSSFIQGSICHYQRRKFLSE